MDSYIYIALLIPIFLVFIGVIQYLNRKRTRMLAENEAMNTGRSSKNGSENQYGKQTGSYENGSALERLKKENADLRRKNSRLKDQVDEMRLNIAKLEEANSSLNTQKDRLEKSRTNLIELQKRKDDLFAIAVHDIKNPAGALKGYVDLLKSYDLNAMEQQELLEFVSNASSRIVEIAQKISLVVAKEENFDTMTMDKSSLKKIIDRVYQENLAYASKKKIKIVNNSSADLPDLVIDEFKIQEVLENLLNNAIKFGPEDTIVQIRSFFSENSITIEIVDNGVGMPPEDLGKIFKKGMILSAKPTAGESSSGLGLWIVKKIVEEHGGNITVQSKYGAGTKFSFTLPRNSQ
ncbi:MAG: hypothetical protein HYV28_15585 [Ignavibacteriales bacterium]|nr:hypothetical protein [Ignavibacteriales bacterium]